MFTMEMEEHGLTLGLLTLGRTNPCNLIEIETFHPMEEFINK